MAGLEAAIAERARKQLGLITIRQVAALGCSRGARRSMLARGLLEAVNPQVLRVGGTPSDLRQQTLAACLATHPVGAASHICAAWLWGSAGTGCTSPEISIMGRGKAPLVSATVHRPLDLETSDITRIGPIPITTKVRTLIDCAAVVDHRRLETMLDVALRDGAVERTALRQRAEELRAKGRPGIGRLLKLIDDAPAGSGRPESWLEREALRILRRAGLPSPRTQVKMRTAHGSPRVDLFYDAARLVVEVEGHATHSTRRQRQHDAERRARLMADGWLVVHFTYEDVTQRPEYVVATIRTFLQQAAAPNRRI